MGGGKSTLPSRTPAKTSSTNQSGVGSMSTGKHKQQSILGFFGKKQLTTSQTPSSAANEQQPDSSPCLRESKKASANEFPSPLPNQSASRSKSSKKVMVNTSDIVEPDSSQENRSPNLEVRKNSHVVDSSPSRKSKPRINYAESSDDDNIIVPSSRARRSISRFKNASMEEDEKDYEAPASEAAVDDDDDMDDFIVSDDSDVPTSRKRKRAPTKRSSRPAKKANRAASPSEDREQPDEDLMLEPIPNRSESTAIKWKFDPENVVPAQELLATCQAQVRAKTKSDRPKQKEKAHTREPEQRYPWLANIQDKNRIPKGHPDYDPSSVFVPRSAWLEFSPFEKQYWELKQNLWDTVVFFKKGKFYELYENDATIGHQLFDLKLTDRVNMRMVGVPESSINMWINQFVAKGYKVARVDQMESALGKEMRERSDGAAKGKGKGKEDKIIRRDLACILTGGTLVDGSMLQNDMAVFCVSIKEGMVDDLPTFGIAFVDAATGQFSLSKFVDDAELTKFETFIAQTNPRELILEKGHISPKTLKILKRLTTPLTIWNYRKAEVEFWDANKTCMMLDDAGYFAQEGEGNHDGTWPEVLQEAKSSELVMSALGGLTSYLQSLKIDQSLLSQRNFHWYNPIMKHGTLVLDGQTLVNLEIFANSVNGGTEGTLFELLNRCVTPFGKRLFRIWVCHPLCNIAKLNERFDAVSMLEKDPSICGEFSSQMTRMPDLERLISRVHAGACRPDDFVKVLDGYEQMEYTHELMSAHKGGSSLIDHLIDSMPSLKKLLAYWKSAFLRQKAVEENILVPQQGIDEEVDNSIDGIADIKKRLQDLLQEKSKELKCNKLKFTDVGKEIYQIEAPKSVKVPDSWAQMSATANVKRYYFTELKDLVRELQESEEIHSQLLKSATKRMYAKFDEDYETWTRSIRVMAEFDCLVSLAKASASMGSTACRPVLVDDHGDDSVASIIDFKDLRHPCMEAAGSDFIPNDILLGGSSDSNGNGKMVHKPTMTLLTGANAAGKSTVLRTTCIAVILAQIGCLVPASSARLTPVDRIMSRLGANDNIFAAQSTFFVELSETKKILSEATPRSLVILDELGRGTSSYDGLAVAQAVLHHVATHVRCLGFFATHYHSLAAEFEYHPAVVAKRMAISVDDAAKRVTFLYKLEPGVAEGSFGMHCASMCGIADKIVAAAEEAAKAWEHTSRLTASLERRRKQGVDWMPLGVVSDVAAVLRGNEGRGDEEEKSFVNSSIEGLIRAIDALK